MLFATKAWQRETSADTLLVRLDGKVDALIERRWLRRGLLSTKSEVGFASSGGVILGGESRIRLWSVATRDWSDTSAAAFDSEEVHQFSPTRKLAARMTRGLVQIRDGVSGEIMSVFPKPHAWHTVLEFCEGNGTVVVSGDDSLEIRDIPSGRRLAAWSAKPKHHLALCDASNDGRLLLVWESDGLYVYETVTGERRNVAPQYYVVKGDETPSRLGDNTLAARFSPTADQFVAVGEYGAKLFDSRTGEQLEVLTRDWTSLAVFSPDGNTLVTTDRDGDLLVWDCNNWTMVRRIRLPEHFRTPWTIPLLMFAAWLVVCVVSQRCGYTAVNQSRLLNRERESLGENSR